MPYIEDRYEAGRVNTEVAMELLTEDPDTPGAQLQSACKAKTGRGISAGRVARLRRTARASLSRRASADKMSAVAAGPINRATAAEYLRENPGAGMDEVQAACAAKTGRKIGMSTLYKMVERGEIATFPSRSTKRVAAKTRRAARGQKPRPTSVEFALSDQRAEWRKVAELMLDNGVRSLSFDDDGCFRVAWLIK